MNRKIIVEFGLFFKQSQINLLDISCLQTNCWIFTSSFFFILSSCFLSTAVKIYINNTEGCICLSVFITSASGQYLRSSKNQNVWYWFLKETERISSQWTVL